MKIKRKSRQKYNRGGKPTAKDRAHEKLLRYLSEPENEYLPRYKLSTDVCGYKDQHYIYEVFTPDELCEIEREAMDLRRKKYSSYMSKVDQSVLSSAIDGDMIAAKLAYQRFEQWDEKRKIELTGKDGSPVESKIIVEVVLVDTNNTGKAGNT